MGKHALLSASSSKRWLSCTPSARLEEQFQDDSGGSVYVSVERDGVKIPYSELEKEAAVDG